MIEYIIAGTLLVVGYFVGSRTEKRHYSSIHEREQALLHLPAVSLKTHPELDSAQSSWLVEESVVIGQDYFKRFVATLVNFVGGRVSSYESLVDRARREAILRLKEKCEEADMIMNLRIETSTIGDSANKRGSIGSIEALAYGTAVKFSR